ncbi:HD domain-containing protein [Candidatus Roizmanbacteria bacterium]|nr:HD domain-containing protein [Candidatus Roizmanbacteria bacterium]
MTTQKPPLSSISIHVPSKNNPLLVHALEKINSSKEIVTLWNVINVNAIERLRMSDHGSVHFQIVSNIALRLLRILIKQKVQPSIVRDFGLTNKHAELVVLLASLLHDTGMSINRDGHEEFSLFITNQLLRELIDFLPVEEKTIVISEVLHAIINHRSGGKPTTLEGGIVRVADALDMSQGRSRIPFEAGKVDIYSLSAFAIDEVTISEGKEKPILVEIYMNNSSGIFQIDELLKSKLKDSGIEKYIEIIAYSSTQTDKQLIKEFRL